MFRLSLAVLSAMMLSGGGAAPEKSAPAAPAKTPRRLESVTWDSVKHQLTWTVSRGEVGDHGYHALSNDRYQISMDKATMTFNGETRGFSREEAANVSLLMGLVAKYAVESTVWWDDGQGERLDGNNPEGIPLRNAPAESPTAYFRAISHDR